MYHLRYLKYMKNINKLSEVRPLTSFSNHTFKSNLISRLPLATNLLDQNPLHKSRTVKFSTQTDNEPIDYNTFDRACEETLESLTEYFEELIENAPHLSEADVSYSGGVLTINLVNFGTYVINKQSPNKQIWLSSPTSGPKRYDFVADGDYWVYKHDGVTLHRLLQDEISHILMEDGNLMDKVHILIQRDMEYYKNKQTVLQESLCRGVVGGRLDFPRYASFAAVKLILWWEEEFIAAYRKTSGFTKAQCESLDGMKMTGGCGGIVKTSDPERFISAVTKSSEQLLGHLHVLTQEALDHADLTVLTGTIGATALLKNCLWSYIQTINSLKPNLSGRLQTSHKKYQEMSEALAERLLDLHTRLLSLYIMQDADSLDWENPKPFFESERGSYIVQMWWLYMQGTKRGLWNTVPPKMAQRVFSGMLNETLTILTVRYTQATPSESRSRLLAVDISNLLLCVAQLLPAICNNAEEFLGLCLSGQSKILRDVHAKCQELFTCFVLRGAPLDSIYKVFRKGFEGVDLFKSKGNGLIPWICFALPNVFKELPKNVDKLSDLCECTTIALELAVLLAQPQPNWFLLLKVVCMRNCKILLLIFEETLTEFVKCGDLLQNQNFKVKCGGFLCVGDGTCKDVEETSLTFTARHYYDVVKACTFVVLCIGNEEDFRDVLLATICKIDQWEQCFDRRQVWNQNRPPWYEAILTLIEPILTPIIKTVVFAVQTGASMYQAMSIVLACFSQLWDCVSPSLTLIARLIEDVLPVGVTPIGKSALLQLILSALYTHLLKKSDESRKEVKFSEDVAKSPTEKDPLGHKNSVCSFDGTVSTDEAIALAIAEALCSIDQDNKHTEQIAEFLEQVGRSLEVDYVRTDGCKRVELCQQTVEILVSDLLATSVGKKSLKILHHFISNNSEWFYQKLEVSEFERNLKPNRVVATPESLLNTMFHIGYRRFDQLLSGDWRPDWVSLLSTSMGLSSERVCGHVTSRWEFRDTANLSTTDAFIVNELGLILRNFN